MQSLPSIQKAKLLPNVSKIGKSIYYLFQTRFDSNSRHDKNVEVPHLIFLIQIISIKNWVHEIFGQATKYVRTVQLASYA